METFSGTVIVVRTGAGGSPAGADVPAGALSTAAAEAEASRDVGAPGTGTFGEESGKNPRPCLPAEAVRT